MTNNIKVNRSYFSNFMSTHNDIIIVLFYFHTTFSPKQKQKRFNFRGKIRKKKTEINSCSCSQMTISCKSCCTHTNKPCIQCKLTLNCLPLHQNHIGYFLMFYSFHRIGECKTSWIKYYWATNQENWKNKFFNSLDKWTSFVQSWTLEVK